MKKHVLVSPEKWLTQYGDVLYRYALSRVRSSSAAEDLLQETLLAGLNARKNYAGTASTQTWLIGILKHKIIDYFRRKQHENIPFENDEQQDIEALLFDDKGHWRQTVNPLPGPEEDIQQDQFFGVLQHCIDALPPRQAKLFILRELEGLDNEQLCNILEINTMNHLWVLMSRARLQLRECLEIRWLGKKR